MIFNGPHNGYGQKVDERCPNCGKRQAMRRGDEVVISHSRCSAVPGPPGAPIVYIADTVVWNPAEWTVEELLAQRDAAEAELAEMRPGFHRRARIIEAVRKVLDHTL